MPPTSALPDALEYAARGWRVLPVHGVRDGACACGREGCGSAGKHPIPALVPRGVKDATTDPDTIRRWWAASPGCNLGVATGRASGLVVLDVDVAGGKPGEASLAELGRRFGAPPPTWSVRTGSGGWHLWFALAADGPPVGNRAGVLPGLDVRGDGGYVVAPPSLHACGRRWEWGSVAGMGPAPADWLRGALAALDGERRPAPAAPAPPRNGSAPPPDAGTRLRRASAYLAAMPAAISQQGGHAATWQAAMAAVVGFDLDVEAAYGLLASEFNPRCEPPWSERELRHKVASAARDATAPRGWLLDARPDPGPGPATPRARRGGDPGPPPAWMDDGPPPDDGAPGGGPPPRGLPEIPINGRQLIDVIRDGWAAVHAGNEPPATFRRGGVPTLLAWPDGDGPPSLDALTLDATHGLLLRSARWVRIEAGEDGPKVRDAVPPKDVARDMLACHEEGLPPIDSIVAAPTFDAEGRLVDAPGYDRGARLWRWAPPGEVRLPVADRPDARAVDAARGMIIDELLGDFPFDGQSDIAHAVAMILLPFVRRMIAGPTPLHLVTAPVPGIGKGLLVKVATIIGCGAAAAERTMARDDDEVRKMLMAEMLLGRPVILLDNADEARTVRSATLASALTSGTFTDRLLGATQMISAPNRATWIMTANNPSLSMEIARRCIRIRLRPGEDRPWKRSGWRHHPLDGWVRAHRPELVHAALVLVRAWIAAGRPASGAVMGSFDEWAAVVGGILDVAGVPGFLANLDEMYEQADADGEAWRAFVAAWEADAGTSWRTAAELLSIARGADLLAEILGDGGEASQRIRLAKGLARVRDRVVGGRRVMLGRNVRTKRLRYRLGDPGDEAPPPDDAPPSGDAEAPRRAAVQGAWT